MEKTPNPEDSKSNSSSSGTSISNSQISSKKRPYGEISGDGQQIVQGTKKLKLENMDFRINLPGENRSVFHTCFNATSHNGFKISLIKSCIQKYVRRGNFEKALYFTLQAFMFTAKAGRTNLLNRLVVIVTEDISIGEWFLLAESERVVEDFKLPEERPDQVDIKRLVNLIYMLCQARKGRIGSHLLGFYGDPKFKQAFPERYFDGIRK